LPRYIRSGTSGFIGNFLSEKAGMDLEVMKESLSLQPLNGKGMCLEVERKFHNMLI
jgi:hypothetical protein